MHRQTWDSRDVGEAGRKTLRSEEDGWAGLEYRAEMNPSCSSPRNRKPEIYLLASHWRQTTQISHLPLARGPASKAAAAAVGLPTPRTRASEGGDHRQKCQQGQLKPPLSSPPFPSVVQLLACLPSSPRSRLRLHVHQPLPNSLLEKASTTQKALKSAGGRQFRANEPAPGSAWDLEEIENDRQTDPLVPGPPGA